MSSAEWASVVSGVVLVVLLGVVAWNRNQLVHRLGRTESRVAALALDLDQARDRIAELTAHLADHRSWDAERPLPAPAHLNDPDLAVRDVHALPRSAVERAAAEQARGPVGSD